MNVISIDSLEHEELNIYTELSENQIKRIYEPQLGLFIAESPVVIERAYNAGYEPVSVLTSQAHVEEIMKIFDEDYSKKNDTLNVYVAREEVLGRIKGFEMTRGALCAFKRKTLKNVDEFLNELGGNCTFSRIAVLEDVQNPTNVGAIFRSAAAMGIDAVVMTSACADPLYRRAVRVSMGNVFLIPWTITDEVNLVDELKHAGFATFAMALKDDTVSVSDARLKQYEKVAIFLGTESEGLKNETIERCDYTVKIPMAAGVDSLNVAAASAVAFWEINREKLC